MQNALKDLENHQSCCAASYGVSELFELQIKILSDTTHLTF